MASEFDDSALTTTTVFSGPCARPVVGTAITLPTINASSKTSLGTEKAKAAKFDMLILFQPHLHFEIRWITERYLLYFGNFGGREFKSEGCFRE